MARKLKRYLKPRKVLRNVRILDASGNVLEEDIEDLPDDPKMDDDAGEVAPADICTTQDILRQSADITLGHSRNLANSGSRNGARR